MLNESDYMQDHRGNLVPVNMVKDIDKLRNDLVIEMATKAKLVSKTLLDFKKLAMDAVGAFCDLSAEKYGVVYGGKKGNVQLHSFDGKYRLLLSINEYIVFDERLQVAKKLIDDCVIEWSKGTRKEVVALINHAFEVNKQGRINTERVLSLRRLDIKDEKWIIAMEAISDSIMVTGSKAYIRIYEKTDNSKYEQISLDLSSV